MRMLIVVHELHTLEMFLEVRNSEISNEHIFLDLFSFRNLSLPALRGTAFVYFREATCYSNACLYIPRRRSLGRTMLSLVFTSLKLSFSPTSFLTIESMPGVSFFSGLLSYAGAASGTLFFGWLSSYFLSGCFQAPPSSS